MAGFVSRQDLYVQKLRGRKCPKASGLEVSRGQEVYKNLGPEVSRGRTWFAAESILELYYYTLSDQSIPLVTVT